MIPLPAKTKAIPTTELLRQVPLFSSLDNTVIAEVGRRSIFKKFAPGQVLHQQNDVAPYLVIVISGKAQGITRLEDQRQIATQTLNQGDFVGELSVIDQLPANETLVALSETIVALVPREIAKQLFLKFPVVTNQVLEHLCKTLRQVNQLRSVLAINRAQTRIYHLLLRFSKPTSDQSLTIEELPNQQTLAMMANVSRESVSRAIHTLIKQNVVRKEHRRLVVISPEALTRLARGETEAAIVGKNGKNSKTQYE